MASRPKPTHQSLRSNGPSPDSATYRPARSTIAADGVTIFWPISTWSRCSQGSLSGADRWVSGTISGYTKITPKAVTTAAMWMKTTMS